MTEEERALWIGERLFGDTEHFKRLDAVCHLAITRGDFAGWLSSPDGIADIKASMIERGYCFQITYNADGEWLCVFYKHYISCRGLADTEAEAVLFVTELALKWVEENPELALKMESRS